MSNIFMDGACRRSGERSKTFDRKNDPHQLSLALSLYNWENIFSDDLKMSLVGVQISESFSWVITKSYFGSWRNALVRYQNSKKSLLSISCLLFMNLRWATYHTVRKVHGVQNIPGKAAAQPLQIMFWKTCFWIFDDWTVLDILLVILDDCLLNMYKTKLFWFQILHSCRTSPCKRTCLFRLK